MKRESLRRVDPISELGGRLLDVEKPSRYLGGEMGAIRKVHEGLFTVALCFPDLYEIGMSNNAIRILYSGLNAMPDVRAERVFAPAPDFEALLSQHDIPLYTLETGIALSDVDMLGFSLGYELAATSVLAILESGKIPIRASGRGEGDPVVIVGGPAATNPHPFAAFIDAAFIGEAESGFFELAEELAVMKRTGALRLDILERLARVEEIWMPRGRGFPEKRTRRAVYGGFSSVPASIAFPLPTVKTVQDHGSVEIMRGCPNGCRFCHAGYFYRPQREKSYELIRAEVEDLVKKGGYREITLASLSSGDYTGIGILLDRLNAEFGSSKISFQLPSLKVNSFTLPIVGKLAEVRKSGLTFAVETPIDEWQRSINKDVSFEKTLAILAEAKSLGFKQAKFYFMIGLPLPSRGIGEVEAILDFFKRLGSRISMQINVNVGTFVPKPHTPFQWSSQLGETDAMAAINHLRSELKRFKNIKISYHSPFVAQLEGIIARGDERVGELIYAAYKKGARLDAWEERFDRELWRSVIEGAGWPVIDECCSEKQVDNPLPWDDISIRVSPATFKREIERSKAAISTSPCTQECKENCGVCGNEVRIVKNSIQAESEQVGSPELVSVRDRGIAPKPSSRMVFRYTKTKNAAYMQHLSIIDAFCRAFLMADIDIAYSEGFNPMPRFETAQPLPIAVESSYEIASIILHVVYDSGDFMKSINARLPVGLKIEEASCYPIREGIKQRTIGSLEWGSEYLVLCTKHEESLELEKRIHGIIDSRAIPGSTAALSSEGGISLRLKLPSQKENGLIRILEACCDERPIQAALRLERTAIFADAGDGVPVSFFEAYSKLT
jgi:radical SAM family uncharacterized protein/radical SAM-linked protein